MTETILPNSSADRRVMDLVAGDFGRTGTLRCLQIFSDLERFAAEGRPVDEGVLVGTRQGPSTEDIVERLGELLAQQASARGVTTLEACSDLVLGVGQDALMIYATELVEQIYR